MELNRYSEMISKYGDSYYLIFRMVIGLMFFFHGFGKFFGELNTLLLIAAIIEVTVGLLLLLGLWTRFAALLGSIQMIAVFFYIHAFAAGVNLNPFTNGGELALLYLMAFLVVMKLGNGPLWSLENKLKR